MNDYKGVDLAFALYGEKGLHPNIPLEQRMRHINWCHQIFELWFEFPEFVDLELLFEGNMATFNAQV